MFNKNIDFRESFSLSAPFINYDRRKRDRLLLQMGYHNPVHRELCHLACEWLVASGRAIVNVDLSFWDYLENNLNSKKIINTKNEFLNLLQRLQKDKMVILFEDQQNHDLSGFVITGEQDKQNNLIYEYYRIEKAYQDIEGNPDIIIPKGKSAISDRIIEISELGKSILEATATEEDIILNIKLGHSNFLYLPASHLSKLPQIMRTVIRNNLLIKNPEFLSFLAQSLKMDLSEVTKKLHNSQDDTFWMLLDKKYPEASDRFQKKHTAKDLEIDLQIAVFINRTYLNYRNEQQQKLQESASRINKLIHAIENKLSKERLLISEKQFDAYYQKVVIEKFKSEELLNHLSTIKDTSLRNNLEKESAYQLLFLGNHPDLSKNFVLHRSALYPLFKSHFQNSASALKDHLTDLMVQFLIYSKCDLPALKATPFYNLEQYRKFILDIIKHDDPFLAEVLSRPQILLSSLMTQNISVEQKQKFMDLFFSKKSGDFLPLEDIFDLELPELLKRVYKMKDTDGMKLIPWWRRAYLFITKKKSFIFAEISAINKSLHRNTSKTSPHHDDFIRHEHNIRPDNSKTSAVYQSTKRLAPKKKEPEKPQNLDEATEQLRKLLENEKKQQKSHFDSGF